MMAIEGPAAVDFIVGVIVGFIMNQMPDVHLHLLRADPVTPQETPVGEVMRIAAGELGEADLARIFRHDSIQSRLVINAVARGRNACAVQNAQRKAHAQRIMDIGQGRDIHCLQVWRLNRGIELRRVLILY